MTKVRSVDFRIEFLPSEVMNKTIEFWHSHRSKKEFGEVGDRPGGGKIVEVSVKINLGLYYIYVMEFRPAQYGTLVRVNISLKGGWGGNWGFAIHILREMTKIFGPRQNLHYNKGDWSLADEEIFTAPPSPAAMTPALEEKQVVSAADLFAEFLQNARAETLPSVLGLMLDSLGENMTATNPLHPFLWEIADEANRLKTNRSPALTKVELDELEKKVYKWRASSARKVTFETSDTSPEENTLSPPRTDSQSVESPPAPQDDIFLDLIAKASAGTPASEISTSLDEVRRKLLSVNPTSPTLLEITLEGGRLKSWGSKTITGDAFRDFEAKVKNWKGEYDQLRQK